MRRQLQGSAPAQPGSQPGPVIDWDDDIRDLEDELEDFDYRGVDVL